MHFAHMRIHTHEVCHLGCALASDVIATGRNRNDVAFADAIFARNPVTLRSWVRRTKPVFRSHKPYTRRPRWTVHRATQIRTPVQGGELLTNDDVGGNLCGA